MYVLFAYMCVCARFAHVYMYMCVHACAHACIVHVHARMYVCMRNVHVCECLCVLVDTNKHYTWELLACYTSWLRTAFTLAICSLCSWLFILPFLQNVYVCVCTCVGMYVCVHAFMWYVCIHGCTCACACMCMHNLCVYMDVYMYMYVCAYVGTCECVSVHVCMYMCLCMYKHVTVGRFNVMIDDLQKESKKGIK